jgi:hypothetical protein
MFVVLPRRGWAEDLDVVQCRGVAQGGRVEGARVGQPSLQGGCPYRGSEVLESSRCRQLQASQRLVRSNHERVRDPLWQQHEVARPRRPGWLGP